MGRDNDSNFDEELTKELESGLHSTQDDGRGDDFTVKVRREEYIVKRRFYDKDKALETAESLRKDKRNLVEDNINGGILTNDNEEDVKIDWDKLVDAGLEFDPPIAAAAERKPGDDPVGLAPIVTKEVEDDLSDVEKTLVVRHKPDFSKIVTPEIEEDHSHIDQSSDAIQVEEEISMALGDEAPSMEGNDDTAVVQDEKNSNNRIYTLFACVLFLGVLIFYVYQKFISPDTLTSSKKNHVVESENSPVKTVPAAKPAPFVVDKNPESNINPAPPVSAPVSESKAAPPAMKPVQTSSPAEAKKTPAAPLTPAPLQPVKAPAKIADTQKIEPKPVTPAKPEPPKPAIPVKTEAKPVAQAKAEPKPGAPVKAEALPSPDKKVTAPSSSPKADTDVATDHFPFSVHVSSYKDPKRAQNAVAQLKDQGFAAYSGFVRIPGKGDWYRIYAGYFKTPDDAKTHSAAIKKITKEDTQVQKTAWSIQVGKSLSSKEASNLISSLSKKGYYGYTIPVSSGSSSLRVFTGAFTSQTEASMMLTNMKKDGFDAKAVSR